MTSLTEDQRLSHIHNEQKIPIFITTLDWNWQKSLARASNIEDSPCFGL